MTAQTVVCVSGADGSGKSSLITLLAQSLPQARVVTIWDLMADPRAQPVFSSKARLQVFLGSLQPLSRSLFLMGCMKASMERATGPLLLVDSYWYKYQANELALGVERARLEPMFALFEKPTLTFHLELAPEVAAVRKAGVFTPYECGLREPTARNFIDFQSRTTGIVKQLIEQDSPRLVTLDGNAAAAQLHQQALARIREVAA